MNTNIPGNNSDKIPEFNEKSTIKIDGLNDTQLRALVLERVLRKTQPEEKDAFERILKDAVLEIQTSNKAFESFDLNERRSLTILLYLLTHILSGYTQLNDIFLKRIGQDREKILSHIAFNVFDGLFNHFQNNILPRSLKLKEPTIVESADTPSLEEITAKVLVEKDQYLITLGISSDISQPLDDISRKLLKIILADFVVILKMIAEASKAILDPSIPDNKSKYVPREALIHMLMGFLNILAKELKTLVNSNSNN